MKRIYVMFFLSTFLLAGCTSDVSPKTVEGIYSEGTIKSEEKTMDVENSVIAESIVEIVDKNSQEIETGISEYSDESEKNIEIIICL